jgi:MSHA biogenesis protein MshP
MIIRNAQKGFSLIGALFLLIIIGALLLVLARTIAVEDRESILSVLSNQAYFAARSGMDWASVSALNGSCGNSSLTLEGFSVTTTCSATTGIDEGTGTTYNVYALTSVATKGSKTTGTLVSRTLRGSVTNATSP